MLGNSDNIKNFNWNPVVQKKVLLKPLKITIFQPKLCKHGVAMVHAQSKKTIFFFPEIIKPDPKLPKTFYFNKIPYVLAVLWMFFYDVQCFFAKKCHFQP